MEMKIFTPEISVIIPVYNATPYLKRCLDSLMKQTFHDFEIITINDGSTDESLSILNDNAHKDSRIRIISKKNEGLSATRNLGIQQALGKFIIFIDADDWVDTNMLTDLLKLSKAHDGAAVICSYYRDSPESFLVRQYDLPEITFYRTPSEVRDKLVRRLVGPIDKETARPDLLHSLGASWGKLYSSEIIKRCKIHFEDLSIIGTSEDELFNIQYFLHEERVVIINVPFYHYWREGNLTTTTTYKPKLHKQWSVLYNLIRETIGTLSVDDKFQKALDNRIALSVLGLGLNVYCSKHRPSFLSQLCKLKIILSSPPFFDALIKFNLSPLPIHWKIFYYCAKHQLVIPLYFLLKIINRLRRFR